MFVVVLMILWAVIALLVGWNVCRTPKGRGWIKILWHSGRVRRAFVWMIVFIAGIALVYALHPTKESWSMDAREYFVDYSAELVMGLASQRVVVLDSGFRIQQVKPELAYVLPLILRSYHAVVENPTIPRLVELEDTLRVALDGYRQFTNRGIRLMKRLQRSLGLRYDCKLTSEGRTHTLEIVYIGKPWDVEQLCALPAMEASIREGVDPALLMSVIRHTSDFNFDYEVEKRRGLLALDSGKGLEQIYLGARQLKLALDSSKSTEDALASIYPVRNIKGLNSEWRKSPLKSSWVKEVLADVQFYRNNGLK